MKKTVAIIDYAHAGTTMLAGMCQILGVPMVGRNYRPEKWEDLDIIEGLKLGSRFDEVVQERNKQYDTWGFKALGAWRYRPRVEDRLRNPIFLAIYKDPVSVTMRRFGYPKTCVGRKIVATLKSYIESVDGVRNVGDNVHFFSYSKAVTAPVEFTRRLANTIETEPSKDAMEEAAGFIQPNVAWQNRHYPYLENYHECK